mmetsp:Transcript_61084/g.175269  ORF Transcript_61084/g.175269 Transcript_61084/m.175269 type:complete len:228 (+) Transcript_61084:702-1385(+)
MAVVRAATCLSRSGRPQTTACATLHSFSNSPTASADSPPRPQSSKPGSTSQTSACGGLPMRPWWYEARSVPSNPNRSCLQLLKASSREPPSLEASSHAALASASVARLRLCQAVAQAAWLPMRRTTEFRSTSPSTSLASSCSRASTSRALGQRCHRSLATSAKACSRRNRRAFIRCVSTTATLLEAPLLQATSTQLRSSSRASSTNAQAAFNSPGASEASEGTSGET